MCKYRVGYYQDDNYAVYEETEKTADTGIDRWDYCEEELVFTGGLADCEAYIRLHEGGYM